MEQQLRYIEKGEKAVELEWEPSHPGARVSPGGPRVTLQLNSDSNCSSDTSLRVTLKEEFCVRSRAQKRRFFPFLSFIACRRKRARALPSLGIVEEGGLAGFPLAGPMTAR